MLFRSVAQSCPSLCDPINRSTPGLLVHHQLPEFTQIHVHRVSNVIQPSHPLLSPSPAAPNPSQHRWWLILCVKLPGLYFWVCLWGCFWKRLLCESLYWVKKFAFTSTGDLLRAWIEQKGVGRANLFSVELWDIHLLPLDLDPHGFQSFGFGLKINHHWSFPRPLTCRWQIIGLHSPESCEPISLNIRMVQKFIWVFL